MSVLIKTFIATTAIPHRRYVKWGSNDGEMALATAVSDNIAGVSDCPGGAAIGDRFDVVLLGPADVECGGTITPGAPTTTDASGKAVAAAPAAGANNNVGGCLLVNGASGDIAKSIVNPGRIQG